MGTSIPGQGRQGRGGGGGAAGLRNRDQVIHVRMIDNASSENTRV